MQSDFLQSYESCLCKMDLKSVQPFTEQQIQPLYSDIWLERVIFNKLPLNLQNPSILRSMLVMDLIDSGKYKKDVFLRYHEILSEIYLEDMFSLKKNIPKCYIDQFEDYTYFPLNCRDFKSKLFKQCYQKFGDIFADNGYEVVGPFYQKGFTFVITFIRNLDDHVYKFIEFERGTHLGEIDMFGHSTFNLKNIALEMDGEIIYDLDQIPLQPEIFIEDNFERYIDSRLFRIQEYDKDLRGDILKRLYSAKLHDKILNIEKIINLVKYD